MARIEYDFISELKSSNNVHRYLDEDGYNYGIRVLGGGESLFFQKNEQAFICEIDAVKEIIFSKSINKWDDGRKILADEKKYVLKKLIKYYKKVYSDNVRILD